MKRERLEDLGRVYERLEVLLDNDFWDMFDSKHGDERFAEYEKDHSDVTFTEIRHIRCKLEEIMTILYGEYDPDD